VRRPVVLIAIPVVVAFALRLVAALAIESHVQSAGREFLIAGDASGYWELGHRLASGDSYAIHTPPRYVLRTPGFPLLLAASIKAFGSRVLAARLVLVVIGTASCLLVWMLCRRFTDSRTSILALWCAAVAPLHVGMTPLILSETFFGFGVLLCLLLLSKLPLPFESSESAGSVRPQALSRLALSLQACAAGACCGMTVLIRPGWLPWVAIAVLLVCGLKQRVSVRALVATSFLAGAALVLAPWTVRNHSVTGHWVVTSLWSGPSLYDGLRPGATGASDMQFVDSDGLYAQLGEYEANAEYTRRALEFARANPIPAMQLAFVKAGRFLRPVLSAEAVANRWVNVACGAWYLLFWLTVAVGAYRLRNRPYLVLFLMLPFVQFLLVHMVFVGSVRYRLPVELPLFLPAATGLLAVWDKYQGGAN
jgi:4-amino-4-deoxy-L-arabinose transferase-like glycosyltransferase